MNKIKEHNYLPRFLFHSKHGIRRHLIFVVVIAVITFNLVFIAYQDSQNMLGSRIYLICFSSFLIYLAAMYFNYFYLAPKLLLKGRHIVYTIALCTLVLLLPTLTVAQEYWVRNALHLPHRISSYASPLILVDNLATSVTAAICFCGVSAVMLFRNWNIRNEQVSRLEEEHLQSELNKLKGQITPAFLSKTLRNASASIETDPEKATRMLIHLGQLLRYQLYDCNRDKILLKSEVSFLAKWLELERINHPGMQYHISVKGDVSKVFVSPLLFVTLVQYAIEGSVSLDLFFGLEGETLSFVCKSDGKKKSGDDTLSLIKKRLELQYPEKHVLMAGPKVTNLKLAVTG